MNEETGINRRTFLKGAAALGATALGAATILGSLPGCSSNTATTSQTTTESDFGRADDEIFTYTKPDPAKTQLVISITGVMDMADVITQFEAKYPECQVILLDITGGNPKYRPYLEWLRLGYKPDVVLASTSALVSIVDLFEDLTDKDYVTNYDTETIFDMAVDGHVYFLPGPRRASGIIYNKTLFDEHDWQAPTTNDEFIALCDQIAKDTDGGVVPFNPNAKYDNEFCLSLEAMVYEQVLGGTDNRSWLHDFEVGNATFSGHMEPLYDLAQSWADHGIVTEEDFTYSATTRMEEFKAGTIAMINYDLSDMPTVDGIELAVIPFTGPSKSQRYLGMSSSFWLGIPKKDRSDAVAQLVDEFVGFMSTTEGQDAYIGDKGLLGTTADAKTPDSETFAQIESFIDAGQVFTPEHFVLDGISDGRFTGVSYMRTGIQGMVTKDMTEAEAIQSVDDAAADAIANPEIQEDTVATATGDFTILQTSNLFCDMFREKTGADIALVMDNVIYRGNVMRIFTGDITASKIAYLKPRSFDNDTKLIKASMTGAQLKSALDDPIGKDGTSADCVYAFSGLKATVAPWAELGSKIQSVTLEDGSALEDDKTYTVAFWDGTVKQDYYDTTSTEGTEGTFEDVLTAFLAEKGSVAPAEDGRIVLVWE